MVAVEALRGGLAAFNVGNEGVEVRDCLSSMCRQTLVAEPFSKVVCRKGRIPCRHQIVPHNIYNVFANAIMHL